MNQLIHHLAPLARRSPPKLTFDRGLEFTSWRELEAGMGAAAWFCDPQAPWQKGTVENTTSVSGAIYPPKPLYWTSPIRISGPGDRLNDTPRKCLEYRTPKEVFRQHLLAMGT